MNMKEEVYWQTTLELPRGDDEADLLPKAELAVIGAGIPGLSAARQFAKRGVRVVMLEAETIGWGASSRNGGMVLPGLRLDTGTVLRRYGQDLTRRLFDDSLSAIDTLESIIAAEQIECGFNRSGHLLLANKPAHYISMQQEAESLAKDFNHVSRLIPKNELHKEIGSDIYYGGLVDETSAGLNPAQYVTGLAVAAKRAGVTLCSHALVQKIEKLPAGFKVVTQRGELIADQVLVTTGGYTGASVPGLRRRIIPIGSYIIATQPLSEELAHQLSPHRRMMFDYRHFLNYFRLSSDRRMIFGGRAAFFPETTSTVRESAAILRNQMIKVHPQLVHTDVEYAWGGTLDFAFDEMPHTGQIDGIYYALGFAGHGVALGTHIGLKLADAIVDGSVKDLPYSAYEFPLAPLGLYNGNPWFLPLVGAWHRILDWLY